VDLLSEAIRFRRDAFEHGSPSWNTPLSDGFGSGGGSGVEP